MRAIITHSDNKHQDVITNLKYVQYIDTLGNPQKITSFEDFSLKDTRDEIRFVGKSIFNIRPADVLSVTFTD